LWYIRHPPPAIHRILNIVLTSGQG
jgi:hypothetical protein